MSDRARLKHGTKHIQKYLVEESIESIGRASWVKKCRVDPDLPTGQMKISVFSRCGEIIANDPPRVALIPNSVLHHLGDVITLRDAEIALRDPLAKSDVKIKNNRNRHVAFNAVLKDILRMLKIALRRRHSQLQKESTVSTGLNEYDSNFFHHLEVEETSTTDNAVLDVDDGEIHSGLDPASQDSDITEDEIDQRDIETFLSYNILLLGLQQDILDTWKNSIRKHCHLLPAGLSLGSRINSSRQKYPKSKLQSRSHSSSSQTVLILV